MEFFESDLPKRIKIDSLNEIGKVDMVKLELEIHKYLSKQVVLGLEKEAFKKGETPSDPIKTFPGTGLDL